MPKPWKKTQKNQNQKHFLKTPNNGETEWKKRTVWTAILVAKKKISLLKNSIKKTKYLHYFSSYKFPRVWARAHNIPKVIFSKLHYRVRVWLKSNVIVVPHTQTLNQIFNDLNNYLLQAEGSASGLKRQPTLCAKGHVKQYRKKSSFSTCTSLNVVFENQGNFFNVGKVK